MSEAVADGKNRWLELDGVRGLAALLVVYQHVLLTWVPASPAPIFWLRTLSGLAWTGVHLFFALSGFLIGGILLQQRSSENYLGVFYARRALRILPLYFILVTVFFLLRGLTPLGADEDLAFGKIPQWTYWVLLQNFPMSFNDEWGPFPLMVTWSVAVEEQFYAFMPLFVLLVPRRWQLQSFILLVLSGTVFRAVADAVQTPGWLVPGVIDSLGGGTVLAWIHRERRHWMSTVRWRLCAGALMAICGPIMALNLLGIDLRPFSETTIAGFWVSFLGLVLSATRTRWTAPFRNPFLVWVGGISYGVYLLHPLVNMLLFKFFAGGPPREELGLFGLRIALGTIVLSLLLAWCSHRWLESPLIALGRRLHYRARPGESVDEATATTIRPLQKPQLSMAVTASAKHARPDIP